MDEKKPPDYYAMEHRYRKISEELKRIADTLERLLKISEMSL